MTDPTAFWKGQKVCVTGGAGFLGSFIVENLHQLDVKEVFIPLIEKYNLVDPQSINQMLDDSQPDIILHLAAQVGGIGANREHPAEFFYNNLMMGVQLLHQAYLRKVKKFVAWERYAHTPNSRLFRSKKKIYGTAIPKRQMHPTGWQKRCYSFNPNPIDNNTVSIPFFCCP